MTWVIAAVCGLLGYYIGRQSLVLPMAHWKLRTEHLQAAVMTAEDQVFRLKAKIRDLTGDPTAEV